jgi:membrane associated rhomboid family serine protease
MGAYIILYPRAQILTLVILLRFVRVVNVHAWVFLGIWIGFQAIMGALHIGKTQGAGVAYWAHIGGFVIGAVLLFLFLLPKRGKIREESKYRY